MLHLIRFPGQIIKYNLSLNIQTLANLFVTTCINKCSLID